MPGSCPYRIDTDHPDREADVYTPPENAVHPAHRRREPEPYGWVFDLSHYEQMIIAKAIAFAASIGTEVEYLPTAREAHDLWQLAHVFGDEGTLSITRRSEP